MNIDNPPAPSPQPSAAPQGLQYFAGFSFFYHDANFMNNLLIGSVFLIIPIVGPIVLQGWFCEIIQRLARRHPRPIPKLQFGDFGDYLGRGVVPFLVNFIVSFPMVIIIYIAIIIFAIILAMLAKSGIGEVPLAILGGVGGLALFLAILLPFMILSFTLLTFALLTEDFGQAFNFSRVIAYAKRNWREILFAMIVMIPVAMGFMIVGMLACFVGMYPAILFVQFCMLHLQWQIYENDLAKGGQPLPIKPERMLSSERPQAPIPPVPPIAPVQK